ncbi:MAG: hypothetical protein BGN85_07050 [Alphaproteobacteria bacterium 64-11]|nr:NAD(P)H-dependent oxidoreductase [Alphaproteobacteria bacterium]OJU10305.1 MAG: hypothetical protein BGN85_07050 [Alphaproteobacteria bacterium 64-11]
MRHVLVINGNPDAAPERLSAALARAYAEGAEKAGAMVRELNVGTLDFPLLRRGTDFLQEPTEPAILSARGQILLADHLVFIFPLWLGGPPAMLKGFMEQIARAGFALKTEGKGFPHGALKGRSARVIATMGMPALLYRLFYGAHGVKAFNRSMLGISGIRPIRTSCFGGVGTSGAHPEKIIAGVHALGRRLQ